MILLHLLLGFILFFHSGCLGIFKPSSTPVPSKSIVIPPPNPKAVEEVRQGIRTEADVTWWGFDPEDSTDFIQEAINSGARRVVVPNVGHDWIVTPIKLRSDLELILEDGVVVTAKKGAFIDRRQSVLTALDTENLVIKGYGATIRMHKDDYTKPPYEAAEWRHAIEIRGGKNVEIAGVTVRDTGGDGIYLGRGTARLHNENIIVRDVVADNNHRQGMSVITVKGLLVEGSVFKNTIGTAPMAGIDFEPNRADELLQDIVVRDTVFEDNRTAGIIVHLAALKSHSEAVSFVFENILARGNRIGILFNLYGSVGEQPAGNIVVRNCIIEGFENSGINVRNKYYDPSGGRVDVLLEDCIVHNVSDDPQLTGAHAIHLGAESWLEGVTFRNVVVTDDSDRPAMRGTITANAANPPEQHGIRDIHGEIYVVNPYGAKLFWGGTYSDVTVEAITKESIVISYSDTISHPDYQFSPMEVRVEPVPDSADSCTYIGPNLLNNPGFEQYIGLIPAGWIARGGGGAAKYPFDIGGVIVHVDAARSGNTGIKMEMDTGGNYYLTQGVPVEEGSLYEYSAWVRSGFVGGGKVALKAEYYSDGRHVGEERREWFEPQDDWSEITLHLTAPPRAKTAVVFLRLYGPGWAYYDDAAMREVDCFPGPTHRLIIA